MDKTPLKKIRMMDIVRKSRSDSSADGRRAKASSARGFGGPKEDQVKFTIERKQAKEEVKKSVVVETTALHEAASTQPAVHDQVKPESKIEETKHPVEKADAFHGASEAPHILQMHTPEAVAGSQNNEHTEPRPESLPPVMYRQTPSAQPTESHLIAVPEVSSFEMDRPIAYIPKEKPTREEKRVLERIEKRERSQKKEKVPGRRRGIITWVIACVLLGLGAYLVVAVLPRAEIVLVPKTAQWEYANTIGASTKIADIDPVARQIPVAVFSEKKTNAFQFPATGAGKSIERKATGRVVIYNTYGNGQQPLVAGTRLETPDGKIFRLKDRVVVPGTVKDAGETLAGSIEADVIADKAGESYNISPVGKLTIPGFQGTSKYDAFYAESKDPMTGGFIGEGKYSTADDIKAAKESAERQMKDVVNAFLDTLVLDGFKVIEGSRRFAIAKTMVNEAVDDQGNFSIYMEAEGGVDALKEEYVLKLMTALARQAQEDGEGLEIREHTLSYGDIAIDAKTGVIALPVDFKGTFWRPIVLDDFKKSVFGKDENELKSFIFSSTSIEKADVALWPFWVKAVPNDVDRVKVELK